MKDLAIIFSDLHLGEYAKFNTNNQRTLSHFRVLWLLKNLAIKKQCPVLFAGDLLHRPEVMTNELNELFVKEFKALDDPKKPWDLYAISGNHDCSRRNTLDKLSPSWIRTNAVVFKFLHCIDLQTVSLEVHGVKYKVSGVPYLDHNVGLNQAISSLPKESNHVVLLHTDYPGAKDTDGTEVNQVENLNTNLLSKFKVTIIGHIHKPQRLSKKVYMVGAPLQQRRTDKNCDLGYWLLKEDFSMVFVSLAKHFPKFIDVTTEDAMLDDGNYYTLIMDTKSVQSTSADHGIIRSNSKTAMARQYLRVQGIKDKPKKKALMKILKATEQ